MFQNEIVNEIGLRSSSSEKRGRELKMNSISSLQVLILAVIQGAAQLLPVSSSAHVIVAEKLMGLNIISQSER